MSELTELKSIAHEPQEFSSQLGIRGLEAFRHTAFLHREYMVGATILSGKQAK